jgi:hypothetical protein
MGAVRAVVFVAGAALVIATFSSAVHVFVVPRAFQSRLARTVFVTSRWLFMFRLRWGSSTYEARDRVMSRYAPLTLLALPFVWLILVMTGYAAMFWAIDAGTLRESVIFSGSSLFTLGFAFLDGLPTIALSLSEAAIGLALVALLIAYLPTMYAAFARREAAVALLEVRAGSPPSAAEMIERFHAIGWLERLDPLWSSWEAWFVEIEENHTSLGALTFFRSPQPDRSWVTAAGAVLDAASLAASTLDVPRMPQAELCVRAGYISLQRIADFYGLLYDPNPGPSDPISVSRDEFDAVCDRMSRAGVPVLTDRDQAWSDFAGWRVNYDAVLVGLAGLTMAPYAPWSSDRSIPYRRPPVTRRAQRKRRVISGPH